MNTVSMNTTPTNTDESQDNVIRFRAPATGCDRIAELLPWFLSGALEDSEAAEVRQHLGACADCRAELAEAADVWRLMDEHPASAELAAYVEAPLSLSEATRADLEQHLMQCSECRGLVDPAFEALPKAPVRRRARRAAVASSPASRPAIQRWMSVAAALAAVTVLAVLGWMSVANGGLESSSGTVAGTTTEVLPNQIATASYAPDASRLSSFNWEAGTSELMLGEGSDETLDIVPEPSPSPSARVQPTTGQVVVVSSARAEPGSRGGVISSLGFESGELPTDL